ncbi:Hypothetical protein PENO1_110000 [Penicillium occitanis (nom. inval.)]|nr:Hypothetical protein PENO1_110000 [Penicillium occitanis (nom. inval.)]PCG88615.1 hypothetical protein PENOC_110250 [Penicillium occitanis (nom. inval.)]
MMAETSLLDGWHEAYYCQWNSAMTLIGLIVAYPNNSFVGEARSAIDLALLVFDNFGAKFTVARNAAKIVRDLCKKIDPVVKHDWLNDKTSSYVKTNLTECSSNLPQDLPTDQVYCSNPMFESDPAEEIEVSEFDFNMAVDIDFWNDLNALWPNINS